MIEFISSSAWAAPEAISSSPNMGAWHAILSASIIVQLTLGILVMMSIVSWAIMLTKKNQFKTILSSNEPFLDDFWKAASLDDIYENIDRHALSPMSAVFKSGYLELRKIAESNLAKSGDGNDAISLTGIDNLERALRKTTDNELNKMDSRLTFLATTASSAPFIGLFGTVWGIMGAFQKIGATGSANLAVVAPGISEALIATAVGLATAIPASIAFNHLNNNVKKEEIELNNFSADFLNITKRNFFKGNG